MEDPIEMLMALRDNLNRLMEEHEVLVEKHKRERAAFDEKVSAANKDVAIASGLAALKAASTDCRHERVRVQVQGARDMLAKVLAA